MKTQLSRLLILLINAFCISNLYAAEIYKRVPFSIKIAADDVLIAEYDLSESRGVDCDASSPDMQANFIYRGRSKSAALPLALQNYRVPVKSGEELADATGKITLKLSQGKPAEPQEIVVNCHYRN